MFAILMAIELVVFVYKGSCGSYTLSSFVIITIDDGLISSRRPSRTNRCVGSYWLLEETAGRLDYCAFCGRSCRLWSRSLISIKWPF